MNSSSGPYVAWHTISNINDSSLLLFGGQPAASSAMLDFTDSAYVLDLLNVDQPQWVSLPPSWANEPTRRIRHTSTSSPSGPVFIIGGEKADGSGDALPENHIFYPSVPAFTPLSGADGPSGIYDHASVMLNDGRLLILGGFSQFQGSLVPFSSVWSLDTGSSSSSWSLILTANGSLPSPRRAFAATVLFNNNVLIHGGGDEVLQQNYNDGWVLNTSSNPMIWTEVQTMTQLGGRRDHFAVAVQSGYQVLFGFGQCASTKLVPSSLALTSEYTGYGDSAPAPPNLYIYDVVGDEFVTTYTPPPPSPPPPGTSTVPSTQNHPQHSSLTHNPLPHSSSGSPPFSTGPSDTSNSKGKVNRARTIALATTFAGLAVIAAVLVTLYYGRRYRRRHNKDGYFFSLKDDDDTSRRSQPIPTVVMVDQGFNAEQRSTFALFSSWRLPGSLAGVLGRHIEQSATQRRDMLADEDVYDDGQWLYLRRMHDAERSSWSFKSFVSNHPRSREPSATELSVATHRREKSNPFSDEQALLEETMLLEKVPLAHPDQDSMPIRPTYRDPFKDPIQHAHEGREWGDGPSTSVRLSAILPSRHDSVSPNFVTMLSPLPEQVSQSSLPSNDPPGSSAGHEDTLSGNTETSGSIALVSPVATSFINANPGPATQMSRTDSWWQRFARNSFLDRTLSTTSRKSPSMDLKEHHGFLAPIEEQTNPLALKSVMRGSVEVVNNQIKPRSASNIYRVAHGKSLSSLRTADTEAIEKIGDAVDVIQRVRTRSFHSSLNTSDDMERLAGRSGDADDNFRPKELTMSPTEVETVDFMDPDHINTAFGSNYPTRKLAIHSPISTAAKEASGGLVAARVQAYERRLSQDNDVTQDSRKKQGGMVTVKYGLAPRPSLFIANPDAT